ncbi:Mis12-Mtw1 protein family-domain-containing protein [Pilobolus umbonatus]|nr:Mis12-Mtw1 protein family-domain-containing protein [Pilobolus umbonatus]
MTYQTPIKRIRQNGTLVDINSGLVFKKKKKPEQDTLSIAESQYLSPEKPLIHRQSIRQAYNPPSEDSWRINSYLQSPEQEDEIRSVASNIKLSTKPPSSVPPPDLYKMIDPTLPDVIRMRQLLIWLGKLELEKDMTYPIADRELGRARKIAYKVKQKFLQKLANNEINMSWFSRPNVSDVARKKPNLVNEKRAARLKELQSILEDLKKEENEWDNEMDEIYSLHASVLDGRQRHIENGLDKPGHYIQYLSEEDQEIYNSLLTSEDNTPDYSLTDLDMDLSRLQQTSNTLDKYVEKSGKYADTLLRQLGKKVHERSSIVPSQTTIPYPTEDKESILKKEENEYMLDILRLLSRRREE